jgi:hypothetical protein
MAQLMETQETSQPLLIGLDGAARVVARLKLFAVALDQARGAGAFS